MRKMKHLTGFHVARLKLDTSVTPFSSILPFFIHYYSFAILSLILKVV